MPRVIQANMIRMLWILCYIVDAEVLEVGNINIFQPFIKFSAPADI